MMINLGHFTTTTTTTIRCIEFGFYSQAKCIRMAKKRILLIQL